MQNNESSIWWCETFILALRRDDEASRHQHQPSNQPCYRPGEVRKCTDYSGVEEKEATSLFHKLAHSNFSTSWGARKTVLINMMLILVYYLWQVQMMQKLHFYTWTWKDNHSSEIWIIIIVTSEGTWYILKDPVVFIKKSKAIWIDILHDLV